MLSLVGLSLFFGYFRNAKLGVSPIATLSAFRSFSPIYGPHSFIEHLAVTALFSDANANACQLRHPANCSGSTWTNKTGAGTSSCFDTGAGVF